MADYRHMPRGNHPAMVRPSGPPGPPGPPKQPVFPSLCPEFLKGVCSVFQCPKNHPEASLLFCQPYQRDLCQNTTSCQYMHATGDEEQYYKDTGLIPLRFMNQAIVMERGKGPLPNGQPSLFPADTGAAAEVKPNGVIEVPILQNQFTSQSMPNLAANIAPFPVMQGNTFPAPPIVAPVKKDLIMDMKHKMEVDPQSKRQKLSYDELEAESNMLKEKVKVLERKIEVLDSTNELLLDKNAKLRDGRGSSKRSPDRKRSPDKRERRRGRSKERSPRERGGGNRFDNDRSGPRDNNFRGGNNNNFNRPGAPDSFRPGPPAANNM